MCRYMEEHLNRILLTWLQRWNSKLWRTASTKLIPYSSLMRQTQLRPLVSLKKLCVTTGFMEDIFQMISNLLLPAIHIESKWCRLIRFVPCSHNYQPTLRLLVADTQQRWFKNLSRLGLVFLSKQLKPRKELVCIILVIKHLYSCFNLLLLRDYVLRETPLRQLVYRVHDLPPSMRPLVYDFGQLQHQREADYTHRIVHNYVRWGCRLLIGQHKLILLPKFHFKFCRIKSIWIPNFQSIRSQVLRGSLSFANSTWEGERYAIVH